MAMAIAIAGCSGSGPGKATPKPAGTARRTTTTTTAPTTTAPPTTSGSTATSGATGTALPPLAEDVRATVEVDLTGSIHLHRTFTKPDGCQSGAPGLPFVVLVIANATDGSRIRFAPSLPVASTFALGDPASAASLEGVVLEIAGTAGTRLSAPQSGTVTFDDGQARAGHFRVTGLQSTTPGTRDEVLDVRWTCG
jgi:hypothetical protein